MAIIHLILILIRLLSNSSNSSAAPANKRKVKVGPITIECPFCQTLGLATHFNLDQRDHRNQWQRVMEVFECPKCRRTMNAEAMHNDGTGVMIAKLWTCPSCRTPNPATQFHCNACSARLQ